MLSFKSLAVLAVSVFSIGTAALPSDISEAPNASSLVDRAVLAFNVRTMYHTDCTGRVWNDRRVDYDDGICIDTSCQAGSIDIGWDGICPDGQVQISYWEQEGCNGRWYGYGYTSRGQCHRLWTDGWKFKALHLRCANAQADCVNHGTCTFDPEPAKGVCQ